MLIGFAVGAAAATTKVVWAVRVIDPLTPEIVNVVALNGVDAAVVIVSVEVPEVVIELGEKAAVASSGSPDAAKLTLPVNSFCGVTVTVYVAFPPCVTVALDGETPSEKVGVGATC